jgi:serine/threonine-protein kinase
VPPLPEDGSAATTAVLDEPAPTVAAAPEATRVLTTTTTTGRRGTPLRDMGRHPLLAVAVVAVLFLGTLAVVAAVADGQHAPPAHGATAPATPRPTPTPTPSATPQATVRAADYVGKPYDEAKAALERLGLRVARAEQVSSRAPDTVMAVSPTGVVPVPSTVTLTVAKAPPPPPGGDGKGDKGHGKGKKH